jgi:hypothetical protein
MPALDCEVRGHTHRKAHARKTFAHLVRDISIVLITHCCHCIVATRLVLFLIVRRRPGVQWIVVFRLYRACACSTYGVFDAHTTSQLNSPFGVLCHLVIRVLV